MVGGEGIVMQKMRAAILRFANLSTCVLNLANMRVEGGGPAKNDSGET